MKTLLTAAAVMATVLAPVAAFAQTYAYVNTSGEVMTTDATDANTAIATAPNIATHSGVMLINAGDPSLTGNTVSGT